jgi:hypothetical protein
MRESWTSSHFTSNKYAFGNEKFHFYTELH